MTKSGVWIGAASILSLTVMLSASAWAQTASINVGDIAYCKALASRYMTQHPGTVLPTGTVGAAVSRCDSYPADSIVTLEGKLRAAGTEPPSREQFAAGRQQLPASAGAQSPVPAVATRVGNPDFAYCSALSQRYNQYLNGTIGQGAPATSLDGRVATENCSAGKMKASILVLESKLNNAKIALPPR